MFVYFDSIDGIMRYIHLGRTKCNVPGGLDVTGTVTARSVLESKHFVKEQIETIATLIHEMNEKIPMY